MFPQVPRLALRSRHTLDWVMEVKWPGHKVDYLTASSAKVKNEWRCISTSHILA
jgi:hypothetical protein